MDLFTGEDGRLRSGWRFFISAILVYFLNEFAINTALAIASLSSKYFELAYRWTWMIYLLIAFAVLLKVADHVPGNPLPEAGLPGCRMLRDGLTGALFGGFLIIVAVVVAVLITHRASFHIDLRDQTLKLASIDLVMFVAAAMAEELAFRGYPMHRLIEGLGRWKGAFITSLLFGSVHLGNPHPTLLGFLNTFFIGLLLAFAYLRTQTLWMSWGIHFGWNVTLGIILGLPVSGINNFSSIVHGSLGGPSWLVGGDYGIEAGFVATVSVTLGFAILSLLVKQRPAPIDDGSQSQVAENGVDSTSSSRIL